MFLSIRSYNFRNLVNSRLSTDARNIYLIGENGQGKSNFLELIYLLCFGGSFRTRQDELLITQGKEDMMVEGTFLDKNSQQNTISLKLEKEHKEIRQNGKVVADRKDLIENIPCIVFKHEDIYFVNGSPERRRLFFNQVMGIYDIPFLEKLREYSKILRMRNAVLKEKKLDFLPVLDQQLAVAGLSIMERRASVTEEFSPLFSDVFKEVSGSDMTIKLRYQPSWGDALSADAVTALLAEKQERDLETGMTNWGPHRDRFCFYMSNKDFSKIASTGQSRLITLAMRNAQAVFYTAKTGRHPIFLIDDVLLELDRGKRERFIATLPDYDQAFFTYLPGEQLFTGRGSERCYAVEGGALNEYQAGK